MKYNFTFADELNEEVPRDAFPQEGMEARAAEAIVNLATYSDANPMLNLSSFVTTFAEDEAIDIGKRHFHKNFIDHDMYPRSAEIEGHVVRWLHDLWNGPDGAEVYGAATIGSSEACMLAALAMKFRWREAREEAGEDGTRPNLVMGGNVQIVWKKFCRYFDVEPRYIPLQPGKYTIDGDDLEAHVDENTIGVVAIIGSTFTGEDDDVASITAWLDGYQERTGTDIPIHADAASGGFVNPFIRPDYAWDFRNPRIVSINVSGHKYGLVPPGLGWIVWRERKFFPESLVFYVNYLGGEMPTATLNFSRGTATVLIQYYMLLRLGHEGYTNIMRHTMDNAIWLRETLTATDHFGFLNDKTQIPLVALTLDEKVTRYNEFDVSNKLREKGWVLSAYSMPADAQSVQTLRIVVRPHLNRTMAEELAEDIIATCKWLDEHGGNATPPKLHTEHKVTPV